MEGEEDEESWWKFSAERKSFVHQSKGIEKSPPRNFLWALALVGGLGQKRFPEQGPWYLAPLSAGRAGGIDKADKSLAVVPNA